MTVKSKFDYSELILKIFFWIIITTGTILPFAVYIYYFFYHENSKIYQALNLAFDTLLNPSGLPWIMLNIPFFVLAFFVRFKVLFRKEEFFVIKIMEVIGAFSGLCLISLDINYGIAMSIGYLGPGFSTAGIIYFLYPFYGVIAAFVGYLFGWLIARGIFWVKESL